MSAKCTAAVFDRYPAGGGEFALALALADNAHEDGTHIFPGLSTMAAKSRQSERSVQRCLRRMIDIGWLEVVKNGRGGAGLFVEYRINAAWLKGANLSPFSEAVDNPKKGDNQRTKRVTTSVQKGDSQGTAYITTITSIEPPLPPKGGACGSEAQNPRERGHAESAAGGDGFDRVLSAYLRKDYTLRARKQWERLTPSPTLANEIVEAIAVWNRSPRWQEQGGRYIPKLATWLRNELWRDAPGIESAPAPMAAPPEARPPAAPMPDAVRAYRASLKRGPIQTSAQAGG